MKTVLHLANGKRTLAGDPMFKGWKETREVRGAENVDAIYAAHTLQRVFAHEVPAVLADFRRVLKPDGFAYIVVPDIEAAAKLIVEGKVSEPAYTMPNGGTMTAFDIMYGYGPNVKTLPQLAHRCGFTKAMLAAILAQFFPTVLTVRDPHFNVRALAFPAKMTRAEVDKRVAELHANTSGHTAFSSSGV